MTSQEAAGDGLAAACPRDDFLLYDGECIYCRTYARKSRFRTPTGKRLRLIDGPESC